jgi:hypothetical protein
VAKNELHLTCTIKLVQVDARGPRAEDGEKTRGRIARGARKHGTDVSGPDPGITESFADRASAPNQVVERCFFLALNERNAVAEKIARATQEMRERDPGERVGIGIADQYVGESMCR